MRSTRRTSDLLSDPKHAGRVLVERVEKKRFPRKDRVDGIRRGRDEVHAARSRFFFKPWGGPKSYSGGNVLDGLGWDKVPTLKPTRSSLKGIPT